jgi:DNA-binding NarL/FixJ family response regulator
MQEPVFEKTISGYSLQFENESIKVNLERLTDDGVGEMSIIHTNGRGDTLLLPRCSINLLSERTLTSLGKRLNEQLKLDWTSILNYSAHYTVTALREGSPIENIDEAPANSKLEYLLYPILLKNQPTTIFSPGGYGKSTLADMIAVSIQFNRVVLDWVPCAGNVLYLDWESDSETHKKYIQAIKNGLDIKEKLPIKYMRCDTDLINIIDNVYKVVRENEVSLVIIDSQMAATARGRPGADGAQISSMYYNALRTLPCASLTIDHVSKSSMDGTSNGNPYGSVVKSNRARSQFEMKQQQEIGEDIIEIGLFHTKFNLGRKLKPIGIKINYINKDDALDKVIFELTDIEDNPDLAKSLPIKDQIIAILRSEPLTAKDIAEQLDIGEQTARTTMNRYKNIFITSNGKWGLVYNKTP